MDGRVLSPAQALGLLPHVLHTEVTLGDFARRRMVAHLLLEVATGQGPVTREEIHSRMDRFHRLRVLRPDGYLVQPVTGEAVQKAGEVRLAEDGTLRAGRYEVGPFYAVRDGQLWPVDTGLEVPRGARPLGAYVPDDGVLLPARAYFKGARRLVNQARRQLKVANGVPIRWYVAEPRMVAILKNLFKTEGIKGIDVVYTSP